MPTGLDDDHRFSLLGSTRNDEGPQFLALTMAAYNLTRLRTSAQLRLQRAQ